MSRADVFVLRADLSEFTDCSEACKKKAVSEIARSFVTEHISEALGIPAAEIKYLRNSHGKPYIAGNPIYFNISHCGNVFAAAFSTEEIGVDIEFVREFSDAVVRRCFTDDEKAYIVNASSSEICQERFFEIWTAKEAFLKLCGVGISGGFDFSTASADGMNDHLHSQKLGGARIAHCNGCMKITQNDICVKNIYLSNNNTAKYCLSVCGKSIDSVCFNCL